jgi:hypothetical protein
MSLRERLRQLASALPSDTSAIRLSQADILLLIQQEDTDTTPFVT